MTNTETRLDQLLTKHGYWTSHEDKTHNLTKSLNDWAKNSLTFRYAVETVEEMGQLIQELEAENKQLREQLRTGKDYLKADFNF